MQEAQGDGAVVVDVGRDEEGRTDRAEFDLGAAGDDDRAARGDDGLAAGEIAVDRDFLTDEEAADFVVGRHQERAPEGGDFVLRLEELDGGAEAVVEVAEDQVAAVDGASRAEVNRAAAGLESEVKGALKAVAEVDAEDAHFEEDHGGLDVHLRNEGADFLHRAAVAGADDDLVEAVDDGDKDVGAVEEDAVEEGLTLHLGARFEGGDLLGGEAGEECFVGGSPLAGVGAIDPAAIEAVVEAAVARGRAGAASAGAGGDGLAPTVEQIEAAKTLTQVLRLKASGLLGVVDPAGKLDALAVDVAQSEGDIAGVGKAKGEDLRAGEAEVPGIAGKLPRSEDAHDAPTGCAAHPEPVGMAEGVEGFGRRDVFQIKRDWKSAGLRGGHNLQAGLPGEDAEDILQRNFAKLDQGEAGLLRLGGSLLPEGGRRVKDDEADQAEAGGGEERKGAFHGD